MSVLKNKRNVSQPLTKKKKAKKQREVKASVHERDECPRTWYCTIASHEITFQSRFSVHAFFYAQERKIRLMSMGVWLADHHYYLRIRERANRSNNRGGFAGSSWETQVLELCCHFICKTLLHWNREGRRWRQVVSPKKQSAKAVYGCLSLNIIMQGL